MDFEEGEGLGELTEAFEKELQERLGVLERDACSSALTSWWRPAPRAWNPGGAERDSSLALTSGTPPSGTCA